MSNEAVFEHYFETGFFVSWVIVHTCRRFRKICNIESTKPMQTVGYLWNNLRRLRIDLVLRCCKKS